jgi:hypothetical protein
MIKLDVRHPALIALVVIVASLGYGLVKLRIPMQSTSEFQGYHLARVESHYGSDKVRSRYRPFAVHRVIARLDDDRLGHWEATSAAPVSDGEIVCVSAIKSEGRSLLTLQPVRMVRCVPEPVALAPGLWAGPVPKLNPDD